MERICTDTRVTVNISDKTTAWRVMDKESYDQVDNEISGKQYEQRPYIDL